eukprot:CAMPEP_0203676188 /NCGR_PEP_ID=MMETSP0090-20130426/23771_1 /ASSEMBLY_ACC=CAM_ASM_001088 /TAXON_ID=426623 /ORGANISM="Chaetoceros affinis, Strain CCMP159" /LENGTH=106 /DNA_ID=CAMNT_0050542657 /DNA_START=80 /DNA_END=397 /DNA_ORIENTATION=-
MTSSPSPSSLEDILHNLLTNIQSENYTDVLSSTTALLGLHDTTSNSSNTTDIDEPLSDNLKKTIQEIHCRALISLSKYTQLVDYYHKNHNDDNHNHGDDDDDERFL